MERDSSWSRIIAVRFERMHERKTVPESGKVVGLRLVG